MRTCVSVVNLIVHACVSLSVAPSQFLSLCLSAAPTLPSLPPIIRYAKGEQTPSQAVWHVPSLWQGRVFLPDTLAHAGCEDSGILFHQDGVVRIPHKQNILSCNLPLSPCPTLNSCCCHWLVEVPSGQCCLYCVEESEYEWINHGSSCALSRTAKRCSCTQ